MVRALVVDDSPTMQHLLAAILSSDPQIEVVGTASDPHEARQLIKQLDPDVITLDINMPGMNGIEFLAKIMALRPMPVVIISSLTRQGAQISLEALSMGAFACLPKPRLDDEAALEEIRETTKQAGRSGDAVRRHAAQTQPGPGVAAGISVAGDRPSLIVVGASTGGVDALGTLLSGFPPDCPPTVIVQHMPAGFTESFAKRLDRTCPPRAFHGEDGMPLEAGCVYIAPAAVGQTRIRGGAHPRISVTEGVPRSGHMPSVDVLFESAAGTFGADVSAAVLTGMGRDGAEGMLALKEAGAKTIAQDAATSMIYGMPQACAKNGAASHILPLGGIAASLLTKSRRTANVA